MKAKGIAGCARQVPTPPHKKPMLAMRGVKHVRRRISEALQSMQWTGHLRAQPHKRVQASSAAGRASLSITAEEASASNASGKAYANKTAEEAAASNTGGQASGVSCP